MDPVRIDLGLRIVATVHDYRRAGILMDDLHDAVVAVLAQGEDVEQPLAARFDFTHFQTRPCKALKMNREAMAQYEMAGMPDGPEPSDF